MRRAIYAAWQKGQSVSSLAQEYKVSRPTIYKVIERARLNEFVNRKSINYRFRTIEFGLRKLSLAEKRLQKRLDRLAIKRYEKNYPGEMVHFDTRQLPLLQGEAKIAKREHLHVAIDDYSRYLIADILPDKGQFSSAIHLAEVIKTAPFPTECAYSDNGSAYRGRKDHAFVHKCFKNGIVQRFTKTNHPQTNGKAERVIRTLLNEWHRKGAFRTRDERKIALQEYVAYYNYQRPHSALKNLTPLQRIANHFSDSQSVNNA
jgi:transposase InsO family protein